MLSYDNNDYNLKMEFLDSSLDILPVVGTRTRNSSYHYKFTFDLTYIPYGYITLTCI